MTPLLLLLTFSIVDFACLFYVYLALENGASQATRYAVTGQVVAGQTREESIKIGHAARRRRLSRSTTTCSRSAISRRARRPGSAGTGGENDIGKVTVTYPWSLMTPLIRPFFTDGQLNIRVESAMKNERRFSSE